MGVSLLTNENRTPVEREVLDRMPPIALEILAIQLCDDDGLIHSSVSPSDDPDIMAIREVKRPRALDLMGWNGFQSSQL